MRGNSCAIRKVRLEEGREPGQSAGDFSRFGVKTL